MTIATGQPLLAQDMLDITFFPKGTLLMMDGSWTDGRGGWYICDGRATPYGNTPNLKDRFIRGGAAAGTASGNNSQSITLTTAQLPSHSHGITDKTHTHTQNAHNHTQDTHNHSQNSHNHTQETHNHTQDAHNHTQDAHNHTQNAHGHTDSGHTHTYTEYVVDEEVYWSGDGREIGKVASKNTGSGKANIQNTTATNIAATATNQAVVATNQATTATNQAAGTGLTATNAAGSGSAFTVNTVPAYYTVIYIKKMV
ncbi:MAG: hypothetical protein LBQ83_02245 [Candidatus Margulisbacteria bacterium]|nr:hypothetical protein [Candidatus Margulisiibacteriota bacterium]